MTKVTPFLWFDNNLEEAVEFYKTVFPDVKVHDMQRQGPDGPVFTGSFEIGGQQFMALNGGPQFRLNEAFSLFVNCKDQVEVDYYWDRLTADGGEESMCGWLKDKFGVSWQIIPDALGQALGDPDPERRQRATEAMLQMRKIDIAKIEAARRG
jgi:predicted 3-demethylubiquinone-9 3-methyltransferase (glyoxalase superfamily)